MTAGWSEQRCSPSLLTSVSHCTRFPTSQYLTFPPLLPSQSTQYKTWSYFICSIFSNRCHISINSHLHKFQQIFLLSRSSDISFISMPKLVLSAEVSAPECGLDIYTYSTHRCSLPCVSTDIHPRSLETLTIPIPASLRHVSECSPKIKCLELRSTIHSSLDDYR